MWVYVGRHETYDVCSVRQSYRLGRSGIARGRRNRVVRSCSVLPLEHVKTSTAIEKVYHVSYAWTVSPRPYDSASLKAESACSKSARSSSSVQELICHAGYIAMWHLGCN